LKNFLKSKLGIFFFEKTYNNEKTLAYGILFLFFTFRIAAQPVTRPANWGIAKMTFLVTNFNLAQSCYGNLLGFDKAFSYSSPWAMWLHTK